MWKIRPLAYWRKKLGWRLPQIVKKVYATSLQWLP